VDSVLGAVGVLERGQIVKKIKPYTRYWEQLANAEARAYAPELYPCAKCGRPVVSGYCCNHCKSTDPRRDTKVG